MTVLFAIHASDKRLGNVHATDAVRAGVYVEEERRTVVPDMQAVREALPYRWRKAFDRGARAFWFDSNGRLTAERFSGSTPYMRLTDARGGYLATIYAIPYSFNA